uniref:Protein kinase domain-containing protein n=1 Tax=Tetradesmus obliquus TaxID=3088 RepID=A0A383VHP9_TETOB|eukprot:jgi/Sobl393_1/1583/SZX64194.1
MHLWAACVFVLCLLVPAWGQQAVQFLPDDVPALASNITQRLIFRASGLSQSWDDPHVRTARLQSDIVLTNESWHSTFNATGGVATLDPNSTGGIFRLTSGQDDIFDGSQPRPQLDFDSMPATFFVKPGAVLTFDNVMLSNIAPTFAYTYSPWAPWRNAGVGFALWPSVILMHNGTVVLRNVSVNYVDPSDIDTPEQYNSKVVFGMRQQYGADNIIMVNGTAARVRGPLTIRLLVLNGSTNASSNGTRNSSTGVAYAVFENVTFNCEPWRNGTTTGISPSARTAAIVVPVVVGVLLLAGLAAWLCIRRRRKQRALQPRHPKDIEAGRRYMHELVGVGPAENQQHPRQGETDGLYAAADADGTAAAAGHTSAGSSSGRDSAGSCGTHPGMHTPPAALIAAPGMSGSSMESQEQQMQSAAGGTAAAGQAAHFAAAADAAAAAAAAAALPGPGATAGAAGGYAVGSGGSSSGQLWHNTGSTSRQESGNSAGAGSYSASAGMAETSSTETMGLDRLSTGRLTPGTLAQGLQHPLSSNRSFEMASPGTGASPGAGATPVAARTSGDAAAASDAAAEAARHSASSTHSTRSARSSTPRGGGVSSSSGGGGGSLASGSRALDRAACGLSALLKARSDEALLRDLKIGPLLGRGSYGRVYKGRWKAVTVAVKIIEHSEGSPGSASSGGKRISARREMLVATSISHPNVVQTYHISTMTVARRNALAAAWLKEGAASSSNATSSAAHLAAARAASADDINASSSSNSSDGSDDEAADNEETWMVLEFCDKGSLQRALLQGRFKRRDSQQPDMIGVYKALLDTASGLDYLHSIGVVHGDLKTCNVLLKGSARDARGFSCKIADFGLSRVLEMDATHISTRTYGTIVYMPSELLLSGRMTTATDVYSFGLMMWELLTSQPIYEEGMSIGQMFYMIAYQNWRPTVPANCPPGYAEIMTACWHQDPEQRPKVQQLLRSLQKLYVAEKQRIVAAKSAAASPLRTSLDAAGAAAPRSRPPAISEVPAAAATAAVLAAAPAAASAPAALSPFSPVRTAAPVSAAAIATQPSAATEWARAAAVAAAARAAFGDQQQQQQQQRPPQQQRGQQPPSERTSFESTSSDRYENAASAASEPSMLAGGLPAWAYPGQLSQAPEAAAAAEEPPAAAAAAAAAADAGGHMGGVSSPPSSADTCGDSRRSFGSYRGSASADGPGTADGQDTYEPWAKAVSHDGAVHAVGGHGGHGQQGADRTHSMTLLDVLTEGWPAHGGPQQQQQQQQQHVQRQAQQQQQQQQQAQLGQIVQQAFAMDSTPAGTSNTSTVISGGYSGYGGQQYTSNRPPASEDLDPIVDTIPSESLFSGSNAVFKDAGEEIASGALYQDSAGFITGHHHRRSSKLMHDQIQELQQQLLQQQRAAMQPAGHAALGYLDALESVAKPVAAGAAAGGSAGSSSAASGAGYCQQQQQQQQQQQEEAQRFSMEFVPYMPSGTYAQHHPQQQQQQQQFRFSQMQQQQGVAPAAPVGIQSWASNEQPPAGATAGSVTWGVPAGMAAYLEASAASSAAAVGQGLAMQPGAAAHSGSSMLYAAAAPPGVTYAAPVPASGGFSTAAGFPNASALPSPFSAAQAAEHRPAAYSPATAPAATAAAASPFAQAQPAAPVRAPSPGGGSEAASSPAHSSRLPPSNASAPRGLARVSPRSSGGSGSSSCTSGSGNVAYPERERIASFMYRTPSGRVINPPFNTLQTVREGSGSSGNTGSGFSASGSKGSGPASSRASSGPDHQQQQQQLLLQTQGHSQLQRQQQQGDRAAGPPPSPFAALAQRAGSLFGPA